MKLSNTIEVKNISKYDVVISEISGGLVIKSGKTAKLNDEDFQRIIGKYAKFLRQEVK